MAISGLVVTLSDEPAACQRAIDLLTRDPRLTLGERFGRRLAAVAETPSPESDRTLWDDLRATPGIVNVDVTFVGLDESPFAPDASPNHPQEDPHAQR